MYQSKYYTCEEIDERLLKGYYDDAVSKGYPGTLDQFKLELASQDTVNLNILNNYAGYTSSEVILKVQELFPTISHPLTFVFMDKTYNRERRFKYQNTGSSPSSFYYSDNSNYIFTLDEINGAEGAIDIKGLLYEINTLRFSGSAIVIDGIRGYYCGQLIIFGDNMGRIINQVLLTNNILSDDGTTITSSQQLNRTFQYERFLVVSGDSWVDREGNPVGRSTYSKWYPSYNENSVFKRGTGKESSKKEGCNADGAYSHAEGHETYAHGSNSHAEGNRTNALGTNCHAEGDSTTAGGTGDKNNAHAEGHNTQAINLNAHAEGDETVASGFNAHAEGFKTQAIGNNAHTEGRENQAIGNKSHAEGYSTTANGENSHTEGEGTIANNKNEHASGAFNKSNPDTLFSVGMGTSNGNRVNAFEIKVDGRIYVYGKEQSIQYILDNLNPEELIKRFQGRSDNPNFNYDPFISKEFNGETSYEEANNYLDSLHSVESNIPRHWVCIEMAGSNILVFSQVISYADEHWRQMAFLAEPSADKTKVKRGFNICFREYKNNQWSNWENISSGGGGSDVTKAYVDEQDNAIKLDLIELANSFNEAMAQFFPTMERFDEKLEILDESKASKESVTKLSKDVNEARESADIANQSILRQQGEISSLQGKVNELETSKDLGVVVVGVPVIHGSQVSGFSANNYLMMPRIIEFGNNPWQLDFQFTTGSDVQTQQNIIDSAFGLALAVSGGKLVVALSSNGTGWNLGAHTGSNTIAPNTSYFVRMTFDGSKYVVSISTDRKTYTQDIVVVNTESLYPVQIYIGKSPNDVHIFTGSIYLYYAVLTINNEIVWTGTLGGELKDQLYNLEQEVDTLSQNKVDEAPKDYKQYVRINGEWSEIRDVPTNLKNGPMGSIKMETCYSNGECSVALGNNTHAEGNNSHAEGQSNIASGECSHAEGGGSGIGNVASGIRSHAEGQQTKATSYNSHAEGNQTEAGDTAHAEGFQTKALAVFSHAEGAGTKAEGERSHAEGTNTTASAWSAHAEGDGTKATNNNSHAEGWESVASGDGSHAEGSHTEASGQFSHTSGDSTIARNFAEHACGKFNETHDGTIFSIGIGTSNESRKNAIEVMDNGDIYIWKNGNRVKLQDLL